MPLTAPEILSHPAFPKVIWDLPPATKGKCPVANTRSGPIDLAYEVHGTGAIKTIVSNSTDHPFDSSDGTASPGIGVLRTVDSGSWVSAHSNGSGSVKLKISATPWAPNIQL